MEPSVERQRATTQTLDDRVARVETDLGLLTSRFGDWQKLIDERFLSIGETLRRIEAAVTSPNANDARTSERVDELVRRMADVETGAKDREKRLTATETRVGSIGALSKAALSLVGVVLLVIALIAYYVADTGRLP